MIVVLALLLLLTLGEGLKAGATQATGELPGLLAAATSVGMPKGRDDDDDEELYVDL